MEKWNDSNCATGADSTQRMHSSMPEVCDPTGTRRDVAQTLPHAGEIGKILVFDIDQGRYQFSGRALRYLRSWLRNISMFRD